MIRTIDRLHRVDLGIRTDHLLTMNTFLPVTRYPDHSRRKAFAETVLERVRAIPGVVRAGYTSNLPLTARGNTNGYVLQGQTPQETQAQDALYRVVTPDFFATIGARLREGRFFNDSDRDTTQAVVIINETFANRHWPGQSPIGKGIQIDPRGPQFPWLQIVGVVKEVRERGIDIDLKPAMYIPLAQSARAWPTPDALAIRTSVDPVSIAGAVRQAIWSVDKDQPISRLRTMEDIAGEELANRRQSMTLLAIFAGLALVLAMIGIYGVLSYMVSQRSREIAVRMAMGARPAQVLGHVAARGMALTTAGLLIGGAASIAAARLLRTLLFEVGERDPWTLASVSILLMAVALGACLIPARRAASIDPAAALRND
jgi:predicted permease